MAGQGPYRNPEPGRQHAPAIRRRPLPAPASSSAYDSWQTNASPDQQALAAQFYTMALQQGITTIDAVPPAMRDLMAQMPGSNSTLFATPTATGAQETPKTREPPKVRKILSLDGGGVRGLSIIIILKHVMRNLNRKRHFETQPWEEFDMIGGTSTGGIIAIMLGRLRMSLDQCEAAYMKLSSNVFKKSRRSVDPRRMYDFLEANGKFSPQPLEDTVSEMLRERELAENELLKSLDPEACRVFVCATRALNSTPAVLRSYETTKHDPYDDAQIVEAVRATSAASTFFPETKLGRHGELFVDGALRRNNPIRVANIESANIWPDEDRMLISIGTGTAPGRSLLGNLVSLADKLKDLILDTEQTDRDFQSENRALIRQGRFYRFNVDDGSMADIGIEEYMEASRIAANTNQYLDHPRVEEEVDACIDSLLKGGQRLGLLTVEESQAARDLERKKNNISSICESCFRDIRFCEPHYFCVPCFATFCSTCQSAHLRTHASGLLRLTDQPWAPKMDGVRPEADCSRCLRMTKARWECVDCSTSLCLICADQSPLPTPWILQHYKLYHLHKSLRLVLPPYWSRKSLMDRECVCLDVHGVLNHCFKCAKAGHVGDTLYICKTCGSDFDAPTSLCQSCFDTEDPEHRKLHSFFRVITRRAQELPDNREVQGRGLYNCLECSYTGGPEFPYSHPHLNLRLNWGDLFCDAARTQVPKRCVKNNLKAVTAPEPANPSSIVKCIICAKSVAYRVWCEFCLSCGGYVCSTCIEAQRVVHRHAMHKVLPRILIATNLILTGRGKTCSTCGLGFVGSNYQRLECTGCKTFWCCVLVCVKNNRLPLEHAVCDGKPSVWELKLQGR